MTLHRLTPLAILALTFAGIQLTTVSTAQAQPKRRSPVKFVVPTLSYDRGAPGKRSEGASRGVFCGLPEGPIALTPQYRESVTLATGEVKDKYYVLTQTSQARPTFALHLPLAAPDVAALELTLVLADLAGNLIYDLPIPAPTTAGVITFEPAASEAALEIGQRYNWAVMVQVACNETELATPQHLSVGGQLERRALAEMPPLAELSREEQAEHYAQAGFWPEAMATVADLQRQQPSSEQYRADWAALLDSIGLGALADAPLVGCNQFLTAADHLDSIDLLSTSR